MVTYFNKTDLIKFGEYLFSEERRELIQRRIDENEKDGLKTVPIDETLREISHADVENFIDTCRRK